MEMIAPDILADALGLSFGFYAGGLLAGLALWLLGWRWHRFWVVLAVTLLGGTYGLGEGASLGAHPLVAGVLLALTAGLLALALARLVAFAGGGVLALVAVHALVPTWEHHLISFLAGGLFGVLLFRIWITALTSLAGALLVGYCGLCLAERFSTLKAIDFARDRADLLNWCCGLAAGLGLLVQLLLARRKPGDDSSERPSRGKGEKHDSNGRRLWFPWPAPGQRKAG
jgi:hypothetical protein